MQRLSGDAPERQRLPILNPTIRIRRGEIRDPKRLALNLQHLPQRLIMGMQTQRRPGGFLYIPGCQEMIEMSVGMQDPNDCQSETPHFGKELLGIPARIDDNRLVGFRIP